MVHILIVDDEKSIRLTLSAFLKGAGYSVETAADADEALKKLEEHPADIVISDIILPRITGVELLQKIHEKHPDTQVVMITGEPRIETASQAIRLGACDYLQKPVGKEDVLKAAANAAKLKQLIDQNRSYQENLEHMVAERTQELEHALEEKEQMFTQLLHQEKLSALARVAKGLAHDINNTLTPVSMYAEMLLEEAEEQSDNHRYLREILNSSEKIGVAVKRLESFQEENYDQNTYFAPVSIPLLIDKVINMISWKNSHARDAGLAEITITHTLPPDFPAVETIEGDIFDAFSELLSNAIDASRENGGKTITIGGNVEEERALFTITDSGKGMSEEVLDHCFDPFFTTKGPQHAGLGLSSVFGIMKRHKGSITFNTSPSGGAEAILGIPIHHGGASDETLES